MLRKAVLNWGPLHVFIELFYSLNNEHTDKPNYSGCILYSGCNKSHTPQTQLKTTSKNKLACRYEWRSWLFCRNTMSPHNAKWVFLWLWVRVVGRGWVVTGQASSLQTQYSGSFYFQYINKMWIIIVETTSFYSEWFITKVDRLPNSYGLLILKINYVDTLKYCLIYF